MPGVIDTKFTDFYLRYKSRFEAVQEENAKKQL